MTPKYIRTVANFPESHVSDMLNAVYSLISRLAEPSIAATLYRCGSKFAPIMHAVTAATGLHPRPSPWRTSRCSMGFRAIHPVMLVAAAGFALFPLTGKSAIPSNYPENGLIGFWSGNKTAADLSPTGDNGSFGGSYAPGSPTGGDAFNLGTGPVTIPDSPAYNFTSYPGWSISFWFNGNGSTVNDNNGLFIGQDNGSGYQPKWFINFGYTVYVGNNQWYNFHVNDYNQERIFVSSQTEPNPVGWNELTVTISNTNSGTVDFYLNGQSIGSSEMGNYTLETTAPLVFGEAEGLSYNGLISDVAVYNRVLSPGEIQGIAAVPEPKSLTLLAAGAAILVIRRRKGVRIEPGGSGFGEATCAGGRECQGSQGNRTADRPVQ